MNPLLSLLNLSDSTPQSTAEVNTEAPSCRRFPLHSRRYFRQCSRYYLPYTMDTVLNISQVPTTRPKGQASFPSGTATTTADATSGLRCCSEACRVSNTLFYSEAFICNSFSGRNNLSGQRCQKAAHGQTSSFSLLHRRSTELGSGIRPLKTRLGLPRRN